MRWIAAALVCALPLRAVAQQPDRVQDPYGALEDLPPAPPQAPQAPQAPQWVPPPAPQAPYAQPLPPPAPYSAQPYPPQPYPQPYAGQPYCPQACAPCPQTCVPCPQACAPYPPPCAQACPQRLAVQPGFELPPARPGEWRFRMDADGSFWREREVKKSNRGLLGAGLGVWLGTWFITFLSSSTTAHDGSGAVTIFPMIGPFVAAGISKDPGPAVGYTISGLLQLTGFVMFVAGAASKHLVTERQRAHYDPLTGSLHF